MIVETTNSCKKTALHFITEAGVAEEMGSCIVHMKHITSGGHL